MNAIRNVCVYCGSSDGADARFGEAADAFGRAFWRRKDWVSSMAAAGMA